MNKDHATHATCKCTNESLEEALDVMKKRVTSIKKTNNL
jgi:hypothetical protein